MRNVVLHILLAIIILLATEANAQVTTSSIYGKVTDSINNPVAGATVYVIHELSGTYYYAITNNEGRYYISGIHAGSSYRMRISSMGYQTVVLKGINLILDERYELNVILNEATELLEELVITASKDNYNIFGSGGVATNIVNETLSMVPTISRNLNDILGLTPQSLTFNNYFAVGGGNYRQSYITVDGAAFNNAFGIGSNLPAEGSPMSLDAIEQISVAITPYDVRHSGFTGAAINAVTKSGTNEFKSSAYVYTINDHLKGIKVADAELKRTIAYTTTYGVSIGGPIIKNKLFFFANGEFKDNMKAGPSARARNSESESWNISSGSVHRPLVSDLDDMLDYLKSRYNYNPGRYQNYSLPVPEYKFLVRLDWNINSNNKLNFRISNTHALVSAEPSLATSPLRDIVIYPGGEDAPGGATLSGRNSNAGIYFESSRYMQEKQFISYASELNSKWGEVRNKLRLTYSRQHEFRSYVGGVFPTVEILKNGSLYAIFGPDPYTADNSIEVNTFIATDELNYLLGSHNFMGGVRFETNMAVDGFMPAANGYYVFSSWDDFVNNSKPAAYAVTHTTATDGSMYHAKMKYRQLSFYMQDQMNLSNRFMFTAGLRFEMPVFPELEDNYNAPFAAMSFNGKHFATNQVPDCKITISPRVGFNWNMTGDRRYVLRGGTGYFIGRLPYVWLISVVGNSNCGQIQYYYNTPEEALSGQPDFHVNVSDQLKDLNLEHTSSTPPLSPTILDKNLSMPSVWKTSLALDAKLPGSMDFSVEGIYNREINPVVVTNEGYYYDGKSTITISPNDIRRYYTQANSGYNVYYITNAGNKAYYYSISASLEKRFDFGLNLMGSYTYSYSRTYNDGYGDQVSEAYSENLYSVNGHNEKEIGYGSFVSPNRLMLSASYKKEYAKHFATTVSLVYDGMNMGYVGRNGYTRYSYTMTSNIVNDYGSNSLLYVPATRKELDGWNFVDNGTVNNAQGEAIPYTGAMQRDDFWAYINQDRYLKNCKGKYAERGGVIMPWHHQLDLKLTQDFFLNMGGKRNTLQIGVDIKNLLNLLNKDWGLYKIVNNFTLLDYEDGNLQFQKSGSNRLTKTYSNNTTFNSTYSIQLSFRYFFN